MTENYSSWDNLYDLNYFLGFATSFAVHLGLHTAFPARWQRGSSPFEFGEKGMLALQSNAELDGSGIHEVVAPTYNKASRAHGMSD